MQSYYTFIYILINIGMKIEKKFFENLNNEHSLSNTFITSLVHITFQVSQISFYQNLRHLNAKLLFLSLIEQSIYSECIMNANV